MRKKKPHNIREEQTVTHPCSWQGCDKAGEFPAPKSRSQLREHIWFCLEHIRVYNQSWDYFSGMSEAEIAQYQIDAVHGHRPSWAMGITTEQHAAFLHQKVLDELAKLQGISIPKAQHYNPLPPKERDALAVFGLAYPVTLKEIKKRYKELVKRYHPDINNNDKQREEQFKTISQAYKLLINSGFFKDKDK
jgi:curved DNA-binding protein CbpA